MLNPRPSSPNNVRAATGTVWVPFPVFHLRKWYLDVVSDDGRMAIAYAAWLRMGPLRWAYSALLTHVRSTSDTPTSMASKFGHANEPRQTSGCLQWDCSALAVQGVWRPISRGVCLELIPGVRWDCLAPHAEAEIEIAGDRWQGLGYVEYIEMHVPPWRLPIDELRWGRWMSASSSLVWIEWMGHFTRRWVLQNGESVTADLISDEKIRGADWQLELTPASTLRDGELGSTVLSAAPCLRRFSPARILRTRETKWLSPGIMVTPLGAEHGWAIHEVVRFGTRST